MSDFVEFLPKIKEKRWDKGLEKSIFKDWERKKISEFDKKSRKPVFAIDTPPPYVNTPIHIGHAYTYVIMDLIARFKRMTGYNVVFPLGLDKNGLPIEIQAEKKFGIRMHETSREEFIKLCKKLIEESGDASIESFKELGISFNGWDKKYEIGGRYDTDDKEYRALTQETFIRLWNDGLIYEDVKPTNYCPDCKTTISDAEVEYKEGTTQLNYIKFYVKESDTTMGEYVSIATTRPELLSSCKVILYNPEDVRYLHLEGRTATVPLYHNEVPIMPHPYAKSDFGTGLVMICSFGDYNDVRILREMDISPTYSIDQDGRMTREAKKYRGMKVETARRAVIEDLKINGLLEKQEQVAQRQPMCWRCKTPIEFVPMNEFYLKQVEFKDDILEIADKINFFTPESKQILIDWINSVNIDWVISRRRYYGTEVPLWYCKSCKSAVVPPAGKYYQPWKQSSPVKACPKCGGKRFIGEKRTFDTWFDSSSSEYYILGYLWDKNFWKKNMPCTLRPQGKEIVRTWLYFTLLKAKLLDNMQAFENCWIHMHVVDDTGQKMSKSIGNIVDPQEVLKKYGADAFRIWTLLESDISKGDVRCSFERIEGTSKFLTKFWNISRFISMFPVTEKRKGMKLEDSDRWILEELAKLVQFVEEKYNNYEFNAAAIAIRDFTWNVLASNYIEMVKPRAYAFENKKASESAWYALHECLRTLLLLIAPIVPFFTEDIWIQLYSTKKKDSIHFQAWPKCGKPDANVLKHTAAILEFNSMVWNVKKENGMSLRDPVDVKIPKELKDFEMDLTLMHNIGGKKPEPKPEAVKEEIREPDKDVKKEQKTETIKEKAEEKEAPKKKEKKTKTVKQPPKKVLKKKQTKERKKPAKKVAEKKKVEVKKRPDKKKASPERKPKEKRNNPVKKEKKSRPKPEKKKPSKKILPKQSDSKPRRIQI